MRSMTVVAITTAVVALLALHVRGITNEDLPPAVMPLFRSWARSNDVANSAAIVQMASVPDVAAYVEYIDSFITATGTNTTTGEQVWSVILTPSTRFYGTYAVEDDGLYYATSGAEIRIMNASSGDSHTVSPIESDSIHSPMMYISADIGAIVTKNASDMFQLSAVNLEQRSMAPPVIACQGMHAVVPEGGAYAMAYCSEPINEFEYERQLFLFDFQSTSSASRGQAGWTNRSDVSALPVSLPAPLWSPHMSGIVLPFYDTDGVPTWGLLATDGTLGNSIRVDDGSAISDLMRLPASYNQNNEELYLTVYDRTIGVFDAVSMQWRWRNTDAYSYNSVARIGEIDDNGFLLFRFGDNELSMIDINTGHTAGSCGPSVLQGVSALLANRSDLFDSVSVTSPITVVPGGSNTMYVVHFNVNGTDCVVTKMFNVAAASETDKEVTAFAQLVRVPTGLPFDRAADAEIVEKAAYERYSGLDQQYSWLTLAASAASGYLSIMHITDQATAFVGAVDVDSDADTATITNLQPPATDSFPLPWGRDEYVSGPQVVRDGERARLYYATSTQVLCYNIWTNELVWNVTVSEPMQGVPVIAGNHLFLMGSVTVFAVDLDEGPKQEENPRRPYDMGATEFVPRLKETTNPWVNQNQKLSTGVSDGQAFYFNAGLDSIYRIDGYSLQLSLGASFCALFGGNTENWNGPVGDREECSIQVLAAPRHDARTNTLYIVSSGGRSGGQYRLWRWPAGGSFGDGPQWNVTTASAGLDILPVYDAVFEFGFSGMRCRDASNGQTRWVYSNTESFANFYVYQDTLFAITSSSQLYSFRLNDAVNPVRWTRKIHSDVGVVKFSPSGVILLVGTSRMAALNFTDGRTWWDRTDSPIRYCDGSSGTVHVVNGMVIAMCQTSSTGSASLSVLDLYSGDMILRQGARIAAPRVLDGTVIGFSLPDRSQLVYGNGNGISVVAQVLVAEKYKQVDLPRALAPYVPFAPAEKKSKAGAIAGGVIGSIAAVSIAAVVIVVIMRHKSSESGSTAMPLDRDSATTPLARSSHGPGYSALDDDSEAATVEQGGGHAAVAVDGDAAGQPYVAPAAPPPPTAAAETTTTFPPPPPPVPAREETSPVRDEDEAGTSPVAVTEDAGAITVDEASSSMPAGGTITVDDD